MKRVLIVSTVLVCSPAFLSPSVAAAPIECGTIGDDRCESWVAELSEEPGYLSSFPVDVLADPSGADVFAVGYARSGSDPFESTAHGWVASLDPATGGERWRVDLAPGPYLTIAEATIAPDGDFVAVVGKLSDGFVEAPGMYVAAVSTADGTLLWDRVLPQYSVGRQVAIGPSRTTIATGFKQDGSGRRLVMLAIGADGNNLWETEWQGPGGDDLPEGLALTPDGERALIAVASRGLGSEYDEDIATLAVSVNGDDGLDHPGKGKGLDKDKDNGNGPPQSKTGGGTPGQVLWEQRYDHSGVGAQDSPRALALSPDGATVFVTGYSNATTQGPPYAADYDAATLAYRVADGSPLWTSRFRPPDANFSPPRALVATSSHVVLALMAPETGGGGSDIMTVALDAPTGATTWSVVESTPRHDSELPEALAVTPDGSSVVVTGGSSSSDTRNLYAGQGQNGDQVTFGYALDDGSRLWAARFRASEVDRDVGRALAVGPDGSIYTVTTLRRNVDFDGDFNDVAVVAY